MDELTFEEKTFIACLLEPILGWDDDERLEELCQAMISGDKGPIDEDEYMEYKAYVKQELKEFRDRLGFG